ncbi:hypothetical protein [Aggregatilinea lenta]|uniref:hypothetical protein n=1 Tax=Aggregatilinea lenta TaxID=913108 RepID=UPI0013C2FDC8|nr:hypothetical protein [Aggregatilinea lenta]
MEHRVVTIDDVECAVLGSALYTPEQALTPQQIAAIKWAALAYIDNYCEWYVDTDWVEDLENDGVPEDLDPRAVYWLTALAREAKSKGIADLFIALI